MALSGNGQRCCVLTQSLYSHMENWSMKHNVTNKVELLAPAGNYESFLGAINAGADAVYLGGAKFGARAYADNFTEEEICKSIRYAHLFGKRVYLTVNTLIKESEFEEVIPYLKPYYDEGLDGVIVQDIGAFMAIKEAYPELSLHVSTQMTVTGAYAAKMLKEMGAVRIVPARELSLEEIRSMKEETGLELETFIHGAMCYCYSGQCLFSSILGGRSGNRGRCAQPCRLPYKVSSGIDGVQKELRNGKNKSIKEQYPLSLKDMCSIAFLPQLIEAGIDSFKIEGRMKKPEYAAGVTAIYRKYIDLYLQEGAGAYKVDPEDLKTLSSLYIRSGIQDGYYFKHNGADMVTLSSPAYSGSDDALLAAIRKQYIETVQKKQIMMYASFEIGHPCELTLTCGDVSVTVTGDIVNEAANQPITKDNIWKSLLKLGNSPFIANKEDVVITLSDGAFYALKALNELRRNGVEKLEKELGEAFIDKYRHKKEVTKDKVILQKEEPLIGADSFMVQNNKQRPDSDSKNEDNNTAVHILVSTTEQLEVLTHSEFKASVVYLDSLLPDLTADSILKLKKEFSQKGTLIYLALPYIIRKKDFAFLDKLLPVIHSCDGVLVRNMESYSYLVKQKYQGSIHTDAGVYCFNKATMQFWSTKADLCCLPYELNRKELRRLCEENNHTEQVVYGRIPLMISANCVAKTTGGCRKESGGEREPLLLTDRYHKHFPVVTNCMQCYNIIYNAVPMSLHEKVSNGEVYNALRLQFTVENAKETKRILHFWKKCIEREKAEPPYSEYTLGHEKRGVE